jgi:hypothetical protein
VLAKLGERRCGRVDQLGGFSGTVHGVGHLGDCRGDLHGDEGVVDVFVGGDDVGVAILVEDHAAGAKDDIVLIVEQGLPEGIDGGLGLDRVLTPPEQRNSQGQQQDGRGGDPTRAAEPGEQREAERLGGMGRGLRFDAWILGRIVSRLVV